MPPNATHSTRRPRHRAGRHGAAADEYAAFGVAAPSHLVVVRADERMAAGAEKHDLAVVGLRLVLEPGFDVGAPEFAFVFGTGTEVNDVLDREAFGGLGSEKGF